MLRTKLNFQEEKEIIRVQSDAKIAKQLSIIRWVVLALFASLLFGYLIFNANKREKRFNKQLNEKRTALEFREAQLREINSTQEKLFSIVGHDLKGPITSLQELLRVMSNEKDKDILIQNLLPKLNNYTNHVHFTLDNLLNWGKNQMKGESVTPATLNLHAIASNVISLASEALLKKELNVRLIMDKKIKAWADKGDINIIFRNLLSNAIKFTNVKGQIAVSAKPKENYIMVEFTDNGVGMSDETQELVCDSNRHYSTFGTNNEKGTGLGLMLCKELILRNNGEISVVSSENNGTTFTICLPKSK